MPKLIEDITIDERLKDFYERRIRLKKLNYSDDTLIEWIMEENELSESKARKILDSIDKFNETFISEEVLRRL
ncbi:MAG: hypothetical protein ACP5D2_02130 [Candidatus Nanoarchaeia archaeon]